MSKREEKRSTLLSVDYDQAFLMACENNNFKSALCLFPKISKIDVSDPVNNYTGFIYAVNAKNYNGVKYFINEGADVNKVAGMAPWKFTALKFLASQEFDFNIGKIFKLILNSGGDVMQQSSGESALMIIYSCDNYNLMNLLLKENIGKKVFLGLPIDKLYSFMHKSGKKGILKAFAENDIKDPHTENELIINNQNPIDIAESSLLISDEVEPDVLGASDIKELL